MSWHNSAAKVQPAATQNDADGFSSIRAVEIFIKLSVVG